MALGAKLARDGAKDTRADRLQLIIDEDRRIAVEPDRAAIRAPHFLGGAHDDGFQDIALLHASARNGVLDRNHDDVANARILAA